MNSCHQGRDAAARLVVEPTHEVDDSTWQPARQVACKCSCTLSLATHSCAALAHLPRPRQHACPVQAAVVRVAVRERVGDEARGGQVGALQVAARQLNAAHHQLARHARRHALELGVEYVAPHVCQRASNGHAHASSKLCRDVIAWQATPHTDSKATTKAGAFMLTHRRYHKSTCGVHGCLGRAVCVVQVCVRQAVSKARRKCRRQRLAADQDMPQSGARAHLGLLWPDTRCLHAPHWVARRSKDHGTPAAARPAARAQSWRR